MRLNKHLKIFRSKVEDKNLAFVKCFNKKKPTTKMAGFHGIDRLNI